MGLVHEDLGGGGRGGADGVGGGEGGREEKYAFNPLTPVDTFMCHNIISGRKIGREDRRLMVYD